MLWSVAALGLAVALAPLYVTCCHSLMRVGARGGHRLIATRRGSQELERLRIRPVSGTFAVPELPGGTGSVTVTPDSGLSRVDLAIRWREDGIQASAEWTELVKAR